MIEKPSNGREQLTLRLDHVHSSRLLGEMMRPSSTFCKEVSEARVTNSTSIFVVTGMFRSNHSRWHVLDDNNDDENDIDEDEGENDLVEWRQRCCGHRTHPDERVARRPIAVWCHSRRPRWFPVVAPSRANANVGFIVIRQIGHSKRSPWHFPASSLSLSLSPFIFFSLLFLSLSFLLQQSLMHTLPFFYIS